MQSTPSASAAVSFFDGDTSRSKLSFNDILDKKEDGMMRERERERERCNFSFLFSSDFPSSSFGKN
jgi:hypothetical protein